MAFDVSQTRIEISAVDKTRAAFDSVTKRMREVQERASGLEKALAFGGLGLGVGAFAAGTIKALDAYTKFTAQLQNATKSTADFAAAQGNVIEIARKAQVDIGAIGATYARLSNALRDVGATSKEISATVETLALGLKANGATAEETSSVMLQLSQAFGKGKLDGDEFRSAMEAAPNVMRALAQSMGVPFGALKDLAKQGEITSDVMLKAFTNPALLKSLNDQAEKTKTIGGAWAVFTNQLVVSIGKINEATGASKLLIGVLEKAATLLSVFQGGEKGSILRNFLDTGVNQRQKELAGLDVNQLKSAAGFYADARLELEKRLKAASSPNFSAVSDNKIYAPNFSTGIEAQDINKIHQEQEAARKLREKQARNPIADRVREMERENLLLAQGVSLEDARTIARLKADGATDKQIVSILNATSVQTQWEASQKSSEQALKDLKEAQQQYSNSLSKTLEETQSLAEREQSRVDDIQRQIDVFGLGEQAVSALEAAKLNDAAATYEQQAAEMARNGVAKETIDFVYAEIGAIKSRAKAIEQYGIKKAELDGLQERKKASDELLKYQKDNARELSQALTNGFFDSFKKGESFGKSMIKNIVAYGKTWLAKLFEGLFTGNAAQVSGLVGGVASLFSGGANASTGGGFSSVIGGGNSGFGNLVSSLFKGSSAQFSALDGIVQSFSSTIGNAGFPKLASALFQNSSLISKALPFAGAAFSLLKGDFKGAAISGISTALGSFTPLGPIGGAIVGQLLGSVFGSREKGKGDRSQFTYSNGVSIGGRQFSGDKGGSLGAGTSLTQLNDVFASTLGSLLGGFGINSTLRADASFGSKKGSSHTDFSANLNGVGFGVYSQGDFAAGVNAVLSTGIVKGINASTLPSSIKALFSGLTDRTQISNMIQATLSLKGAQSQLAEQLGATVDQAAQAAKATGLAGDSLVAYIAKLGSFVGANQTIGDVLVAQQTALQNLYGGSLPATLQIFDSAIKAIDKTTASGINSFNALIGIRDAFSQFTGSIDGLKGGVKGALFNIVGDAEKQQILQADLAKAFGELNIAVPGSIQELITLGKSIDFTSKAGLDLASVFPSLVDGFSKTQDAATSLADSLREGSLFATAFDYRRYTGVAGNYGTAFANSYVDGLTQYPVNAPNIGRVDGVTLTAPNIGSISAGNADLITIMRSLLAEISEFKNNTTSENKGLNLKAERTMRAIEQINVDGVILRPKDNANVDVVLKVKVVP